MASKLKLTELLYPTSTTAAITINSDDSVTIPTQSTTTITTSGNVTVGGTLAVGGGNISPQTGFKNRIINGAMTIDQRNAGAVITIGGSDDAKYPVDRFFAIQRTDGTYTAQRVSTAPNGFINSVQLTITAADASLGSTQFSGLFHNIEGFNTADLGWGSANAQAITLTFWVQSSLTGMFGGSLRNSAVNRSYPFSYTINAANTWEQKSITISGDTTGTWLTDNGIGVRVAWSLGCGSSFLGTSGIWAASDLRGVTGEVSLIGTIGATFYITGVQLEKGSTATPFEFRSIGQELALCQRYYSVVSGFSGYGYFSSSSASLITTVPLPVTMRATPTITITSSGSLTAGYSTAVYGTSGLTAFSYQVISNAAGTGGSLLASATAAIEL